MHKVTKRRIWLQFIDIYLARGSHFWTQFQVGSGDRIKFWNEVWVEERSFAEKYQNIYLISALEIIHWGIEDHGWLGC